jgi:hypothetical protein
LAKRITLGEDLEEYRRLLDVPAEFEDGFNLRTVLGALFIGFVMMPASIYLSLVAGQQLGEAAQWTTLILFTEIAKRSFSTVKKQEIFIIFYMAGGLAAAGGGPIGGMMWNQYLRHAPAAVGFGIADQIPDWVVPPGDSLALAQRTFLHHDWLVPVGISLFLTVMGKLQWLGIGYGMFRWTSDVEKLPFPMAPVQALGIIAVAESTGKEQTWRWRLLSTGAMIGLIYGFFWVGIPALTSTVASSPFQLIPIPWIDLTPNTQKILPAAPTGISTDLRLVLTGAVVPFWAVIGQSIAAAVTLFVNPLLYRMGYMTTWREGMDTINTDFAAQVDFWISFRIGLGIAFFVYSVGNMVWVWHRNRREGIGVDRSYRPPPGRGDIPVYLVLSFFVVSTLGITWLCHRLVPSFPLLYLLIFGFIVTPAESLISARMLGMAGQWIGIPMLREGTFILSGYRGVDIWFAPIPLADMGTTAQYFRVVELTGTKIWSVIKADLVITPILIISGLLFWQFAWKLAPIPSNQYPDAEKTWPLRALHSTFWMTATSTEGESPFLKAFSFGKAALGFGVGLTGLTGLSALRLPVTLVYGFINGMGMLPHAILPQLAGALLGRLYLERRLGRDTWRRYSVVVLAGYGCGMGLVALGSSAIAMITKSVSTLPY